MTIRKSSVPLLSLFALVLVPMACGSDNSSAPATSAAPISGATSTSIASSSVASGSASTANAQLCADRDALKSSIQDLASVNIIRNGTTGLQTALDKVRANLQALKKSASADLQPDVTALEDAVTKLQSALNDVGANGIGGVVTAAKDVGQAGTTLLASLASINC
jgi:hypothetical protein